MLRKRCVEQRKGLVGIILSLVVGISLIAQPMVAFAEVTSNTVDNSVDKSTARVVGVLNTVSCYCEYGHEFLTVYDSGEKKVDYTNPKNDYIKSLVEAAKGKVDRFGELSCEAGGEYLGYEVSESETNYDNRSYTWVSDDSDNHRHMEIDGDYARKITITVFGTANVEHPWDDGVVTKEATIEEDGEMTYTCNNCGEIKTELIPKIDSEQKIIEKPAYKGDIIEDGQTHFMSEFYALDDLPDGTLVIVTNDEGDEIFLSLADLKALSGSDPVDDSFTLSLPKGYAFADGSTRCSCPFKILAAETQNSDAPEQASTPSTQPTSPQTGDNSNVLLWVMLLAVSGAVLTGTAIHSRKRIHK